MIVVFHTGFKCCYMPYTNFPQGGIVQQYYLGREVYDMSNILIFCLTLVIYLVNELTFLQPLGRIHSKLVLFFHHLETCTLLGIPEGTVAIYIATCEISLDTILNYENGYMLI